MCCSIICPLEDACEAFFGLLKALVVDIFIALATSSFLEIRVCSWFCTSVIDQFSYTCFRRFFYTNFRLGTDSRNLSRPPGCCLSQRLPGRTCRETCQGQEWGLASFPDTILSAMLGLKWAIPQSLGQSEGDSGGRTQIKNRKMKQTMREWLHKVSLCSLFSHPGGGACAEAAVRGWVCMLLLVLVPCSRAAAAAETEKQEEGVQVRPSLCTESPASTALTLFILSGGALDCSPVAEFPLLLRKKKGHFRESHQHFHIQHM